jgi:hypothetical protein
MRAFHTLRFVWLILIWLFVSPPALSQQTPPPVLFFSDLTSGPAIGNSDPTYTVNGGAYVSLYGNFLVGGTVTLNGVSCLYSISGPSPYLWYQKWIVQLTSACSTGNFAVTSPAGTSNTLPFTVRSGSIYYVSTSGKDNTGNGSFPAPWATMAHCVQAMAAEGICYVENGVATGANQDSGGWGALTLRQSWCGPGPNGFPRAIITYPGATATIGAINGYGLVSTDSTAGDGACVGYWTISGLTVLAGQPSNVAVSLNGPAFPGGSSNWRVIGTDEACPQCNGSSAVLHTLQLAGTGNTNKFLGNFIHDSGLCLGTPCYPDGQFHGMYISDNSRHYELGWNLVENIFACRGIQVFSNQNDEYDVFIHDNTIHDTTCDAIVLSTLDPSQGPVSVFNNVMYHVGIGPQNVTEGGGSFDCIYRDRHLQTGKSGSGQINVYNNTCFDSGSVKNLLYGNCDNLAGYNLSNNDDTTTMLMQNNIAYQTYVGNPSCSGGVPYFTNNTNSSTALFGSNNLFYGVNAPTANGSITSTITSNPMFVNTSDISCPATCPVDLHLSTSVSPTIKAGSTVGPVPLYDHDGILRPSPPSIGAYEYAANATARPNPPANLNVVVVPRNGR